MTREINKRVLLLLLILTPLSLFVSACKSSGSKAPQTAEAMYNEAVKLYEDEDWEEANKLFEVIKLQYGASMYADDSQYYIAEINFNKGEFILAAYHYNSLRRTFPTSQYYKISLYKAGLCYYELAPPYDRDQEYTVKAISIFQDYQRLYFEDSLSAKAGEYIDELRDRLAHRDFFTAKLYRKLHTPKSALIYLDVVISEYPDTKYYELAYYEKIDILSATLRIEEIKTVIDKYKNLFPNGEHLKEVLAIEKQLPE